MRNIDQRIADYSAEVQELRLDIPYLGKWEEFYASRNPWMQEYAKRERLQKQERYAVAKGRLALLRAIRQVSRR